MAEWEDGMKNMLNGAGWALLIVSWFNFGDTVGLITGVFAIFTFIAAIITRDTENP